MTLMIMLMPPMMMFMPATCSFLSQRAQTFSTPGQRHLPAFFLFCAAGPRCVCVIFNEYASCWQGQSKLSRSLCLCLVALNINLCNVCASQSPAERPHPTPSPAPTRTRARVARFCIHMRTHPFAKLPKTEISYRSYN